MMMYQIKKTILITLIFIVIGTVVLSFYPLKKIPEVIPTPVINTEVEEGIVAEEPKLPEPCYDDNHAEIDCDFLAEKTFVEKYIKDNIKTLALNQPVLGGLWYVTSVSIIPSNHNGEVTYEDGHIQSKAKFIYTYEKEPQKVIITNFEVLGE